MQVGEVMSRNLLVAEAAMSLQAAAERMCERDVGALLVLTGESLAGILTERDVLRAVSQGRVEGTNVAAWMTREPETIEAGASPRKAAAMMIRGGFRHLPVVDGSRPVGIVSIRDLMRIVVDEE